MAPVGKTLLSWYDTGTRFKRDTSPVAALGTVFCQGNTHETVFMITFSEVTNVCRFPWLISCNFLNDPCGDHPTETHTHTSKGLLWFYLIFFCHPVTDKHVISCRYTVQHHLRRLLLEYFSLSRHPKNSIDLITAHYNCFIGCFRAAECIPTLTAEHLSNMKTPIQNARTEA